MIPSNKENSSLPKIRSYSVRDFIDMELPERKELLEPWLPEQGLAMIHAPRGVGKTFFALSCAYAIGTGGKFLTFKAPEARSVLYLDGEMPGAAIKRRLRQLMPLDATDPPVNIITPDVQDTRSGGDQPEQYSLSGGFSALY